MTTVMRFAVIAIAIAMTLALCAYREPAPAVDSPPGEISPEAPRADAITFKGYGSVQFGADPEAVRSAWRTARAGDLQAAPPEPAVCHYLMPKPPPPGGYRIAFMIEDDRFRRVDVKAPDIVAPGGGRVGMSVEEIEALYSGRIETRPHKYIEGGQYLRITDDTGGDGVLLFAADDQGRVTEWRVGVPPQVDYVEGCS